MVVGPKSLDLCLFTRPYEQNLMPFISQTFQHIKQKLVILFNNQDIIVRALIVVMKHAIACTDVRQSLQKKSKKSYSETIELRVFSLAKGHRILRRSDLAIDGSLRGAAASSSVFQQWPLAITATLIEGDGLGEG